MTQRRRFLTALAAASAGAAATLPRQAPDFVFVLPDGAKRKLSEFKGKVVAVSFISTS
jgi:ABC-type nitrate/sulfonate/bicarbonate transport system substrate-binding protein